MNEIETIFQKSSSNETWFCSESMNLENRAMNFGDGLFETMVWKNGEIRFLDKHIQRLSQGMKILNLNGDAINTAEIVSFLKDHFSNQTKRVRWNIYRSGAGKYTPESSDVIQTLQITDYMQAPEMKKKVDVSRRIQLFPTAWSSFKSLNCLPYVLANQERKERQLDEIILLDYRGFISEAGASNFFWIKSGVVYTPSLNCSCINGVSRQVILEHLTENLIPFVEGQFLLDELETAELIFVSNCTGISYLENFKEKIYTIDPPLYLGNLFN